MSKSLTEILKELNDGIVYTAKGKPRKSFSKADFEKVAKAYMNTPELEVIKVQKKGDSFTETPVKPVKAFRQIIEKVLRDFGVDKADAAKVLEEGYEIKTAAGLYEFVSELIYTYMDAGKKFDFMTKEDFIGGISLDTVDEVKDKLFTMKDKDGNIKGEYLVSTGKHKQLVKKSKCPEWKKTKTKK